jgi:HEAT repeat protein
MHDTIDTANRMVNDTECTAYRVLPAITTIQAQTEQFQSRQGSGSLKDIRKFVGQTFIHGVPYEEATQYGTETVPSLLAMLGNATEGKHWSNIVIVLGIIGDEQAVEPLIAFIEANGKDRLLREHYTAKTSALMALGYLINKTGNEKALNYLAESVKPEIWASRSSLGIAPFQANIAERDIDFSKHAILGLALSGRPEAAQVLRSLQQPPMEGGTEAQRAFRVQVSDMVLEALNEHERISTRGLLEYYRKAKP